MGICTSKSSVKSNDQDRNNERAVPNSRENVNPPTTNVSDPKPEQEREEGEGSPVAPTSSPNESITPVAQGSLPHHERAQGHDKQEEGDNEKGKIIDADHGLDPNAAATKIQAVFKGHQVRKNQHNLHKPLDDLNTHSQTPSPEKVVEKVPEINLNTSAKSENLPSIDPNEAATKIQAVFKGRQVRKNFKEHYDLGHPDSAETGSNKLIEIKAPTETSNPDNAITQGDAPHNPRDSPVHHEEDHDCKMDEEEAATKIQAYFKGFKTRKELEKEFHHHKIAS